MEGVFIAKKISFGRQNFWVIFVFNSIRFFGRAMCRILGLYNIFSKRFFYEVKFSSFSMLNIWYYENLNFFREINEDQQI